MKNINKASTVAKPVKSTINGHVNLIIKNKILTVMK